MRAAQFGVEDLQHLIKGEGWHLVVKLGQFHDEGRRKQECARGKKLAQFDKGRSQLFKGAPQPFGRRHEGDFRLRLTHLAKGQAQRIREREAFRQVAVTVFEEDADDNAEPLDVLHRPSPFCVATEKHSL